MPALKRLVWSVTLASANPDLDRIRLRKANPIEGNDLGKGIDPGAAGHRSTCHDSDHRCSGPDGDHAHE